jgi:outer membrane autotransporter protein
LAISKRRVLAAAAAVFSSLLALPLDAAASVGCDAVNSGAFNISLAPFGDRSILQTGFAVGDTVNFTITISGHGHLLLLNTAGGNFVVLTWETPTTETLSYSLLADQLNLTARYATDSPASLTGVVTCTPTAPATVASISPISGAAGGGTAVTISGTGFTGATGVTIGGVAATFAVVNATTITAATPAHAVGTVDVVVTRPGSAGTGTGLFTYIAAPTVTAILPVSGPTGSGTAITISGTNFTGATAVTIGGVAATGIAIVNPTTITATTPAHAAGTVNVAVTTSGGTGTGTGLFTYIAAPTVTVINPASGPITGGTSVTISGTDFTAATAVAIGGVAASGFTVVNATTITAITPVHAFGAVNIVVTTASGTGTGLGLFTYVDGPTVTAVSPAGGPMSGGTAITITGTDFTGATAVTIGGVAATATTVVDANTITAVTPAHTAGAVDVAVTTPSGTLAGSGLYTYLAAPTVTAINPASGPITGGTAVTITGTSLIGVTAVTIGGVAATGIAVVNATTIRAVTSAHSAGTASVMVTAPIGVGTGTGIYSYVSAPKVAAVNPAEGTTAGGTRITITGTAFTGARTVTVGGVAATSVTVVSTTTITAITPAHDAGAVNVAVTTPSGTDTGRYTYINTLALASTAAAAMQVGQNYSQTNVASGGTPAYAYAISSGNLPAGTTLNTSTGLVSGMPTTKGTFSYTIEVTDSGKPELRVAHATAAEIMAILTTTALVSSHDPSLTGQPVTLTATVTPTSAAGGVTFEDGTAALCTAMPLASGVATCTTAFAASGAHAITATFSGSTALGASTSATMVQTVNDQRVETVEAIGKFLSRRNDLIAANEPDGSRQIDRLVEVGTDSPASSGARPVRVNGSSSGPMRFALATSLSQMLINVRAAQGASVLATPSKSAPFDVWIDGMYGSFQDHRSSSDIDGHFGIVSVGADYVLNRKLLVGGMVQFDSMRQRSSQQTSDVSGRGWMAGPYATVRLVDNVFLQARAALGRSRNDVSPFQSYSDKVETDRRLISSALSGRWLVGAWVLRPSATLAYIEDVAASYTETFNVVIPEVKSRLGQARVGPEVGYRRQLGPDVVVEPRAGLLLISNFAGDTVAAGLGQIIGENGRAGTRGRAEFGVRVSTLKGFGIDLSGSYDGIGANDYPTVTGRAMVHVSLK